MSISDKLQRLATAHNAIASAILEKGGTVNNGDGFEEFASDIATIPPISEKKAVNFFDYNGVLLHSYTFSEAAALSALPATPIHSGLSSQGWDYTLAQIKSEVQNQKAVNVGATYTTGDGSTKLYLFVAKGTRIPNLQICLTMDAGSSASIDWGDGTTDTINNPAETATAVYAEKTNYSEVADDTILCVRIIGGSFWVGGGSPSRTVFGSNNLLISTALVKAELGNNCKGIAPHAFLKCYRLTSIVISNSVTIVGEHAFKDCYSLTCVVIPTSIINIYPATFSNCQNLTVITIPASLVSLGDSAFYSSGFDNIVLPNSVTSIGRGIFNGCFALSTVVIPSVTDIGNRAFANCYSLTVVVIPASVTSIGDSAFYSSNRLYKVDLTQYTDPLSIPILTNINAFDFTSPYLIFSVANAEMLAAFSSATNWSTFVSQFVIEEG